MNDTRASTTGISSSAISEPTPGPRVPKGPSQLQCLFTAVLSDDHSRVLWGAEIKQNPPTVTYAEVMDSEEGVAKMTSLIVGAGPIVFRTKT